jgi:hypothetical protein
MPRITITLDVPDGVAAFVTTTETPAAVTPPPAPSTEAPAPEAAVLDAAPTTVTVELEPEIQDAPASVYSDSETAPAVEAVGETAVAPAAELAPVVTDLPPSGELPA